MLTASLQALLAQAIDYAGMFPPASLDLETALKNQAQYLRSEDAWMLHTFVLPVEQFDAAKPFLAQFDPQHPLRVAALGPRAANAEIFLETLESCDAAIRAFAKYDVDLISISHLEMPLPLDADSSLLSEARAILGDLPVFWETPPERAGHTIALLAEFNSNQDAPTFGCKMRTGGVTPHAFPTCAQIAGALVTPATHQVPVKFTAGLHHPIRQFRDEVKTKMHGFLNVLGAAVLAAEHRWDASQTALMLEDENPASFRFIDDCFAWRQWKIGIERLAYRRKFAVSFGSCSFDEPRQDLRALAWL
jgi:hypothetical protein